MKMGILGLGGGIILLIIGIVMAVIWGLRYYGKSADAKSNKNKWPFIIGIILAVIGLLVSAVGLLSMFMGKKTTKTEL